MRILREWIQRLWGTVGGSRPDEEIDEELKAHLELAAEVARRRGLAPDAVPRAARKPWRRYAVSVACRGSSN